MRHRVRWHGTLHATCDVHIHVVSGVTTQIPAIYEISNISDTVLSVLDTDSVTSKIKFHNVGMW